MPERIAKSIKHWLIVLVALWCLNVASNIYLNRAINVLNASQQTIEENQRKLEILQAKLDTAIKKNDAMLQARKTVQVASIRVLRSQNLYTDAEKRAIADSWELMQYDGEPNPFADYKTK